MYDSTLKIVSNTSLSIFFGIVVGVVLAPVIAYADQSFRKNDAFTKTNFLLIATWTLVPVFTLYFAYTLFSGHYETAKALAPLGMMIAAMIASASVMKNIAETKANDLTKSKEEKIRKSAFALDTMIAIHTNISIFIRKNDQYVSSNNLYFSRNKNLKFELAQTSEIIKKMIDSLFSETILTYLNEDERTLITNFHIQFYSFYMKYILSQKNTVISSNKKNYLRPYKNLYDYEDIFSMDRFNTLKQFAEEYIHLINPNKDPQ